MGIYRLKCGFVNSVAEDATIDVFNCDLGDDIAVRACNKYITILLHYRKIILKCNRASAASRVV